MESQFNLLHSFEQVAKGAQSPEEVFATLTPRELSKVIYPYFADSDERVFAQGEGILEGDVSGHLVLDKDVAAALRQDVAEKGNVTYIYSVAEGDIDDFSAIGAAAAFFTNNPGKTTFSPVQSVSEGVPTVIDVALDYHESDEPVELTFTTHTGQKVTVATRKRWICGRTVDGEAVTIAEGDMISMSGELGRLFAGRRNTVVSPIDDLYRILSDAYLEAEATNGSVRAWDTLSQTTTYLTNKRYLEEILRSELFSGFQKLRDYALDNTPLKVLVNVHNTSCVVKTRLLSATLSAQDDGIGIDVGESRYGVGLLRDERMWTDPRDIDLLRVLLLGESCTDPEHYAQVVEEYRERHGQKYFSIFTANPGATCVVRTLCMPFSKFLPDTFDVDAFAERHGMDVDKVRKAFRKICGEREVYHGCRGIRLFSIRPDFADLWLDTVLNALRRARESGVSARVRFLLATLTIPEEAGRFIRTLEAATAQVFGSVAEAPIDGVATMLETSGAYISLEQILEQRGEFFELNGGLIGSNDFTTACLNMNRGDAPRYLIPSYVEQGLFPASPFRHVYAPVVGRAMHTALQRSTSLGLQTDRRFLWGLAGELTTDWKSVQWLATYLAPAGLDYISTSPETIISALFAAMSSQSQWEAAPSAA